MSVVRPAVRIVPRETSGASTHRSSAGRPPGHPEVRPPVRSGADSPAPSAVPLYPVTPRVDCSAPGPSHCTPEPDRAPEDDVPPPTGRPVRSTGRGHRDVVTGPFWWVGGGNHGLRRGRPPGPFRRFQGDSPPHGPNRNQSSRRVGAPPPPPVNPVGSMDLRAGYRGSTTDPVVRWPVMWAPTARSRAVQDVAVDSSCRTTSRTPDPTTARRHSHRRCDHGSGPTDPCEAFPGVGGRGGDCRQLRHVGGSVSWCSGLVRPCFSD